jgi:hypothetical protein
MTEDRAANDAERKQCTVNDRARNQQQHRSNQLRDAGADASPRFHSERGEDIHGFASASELEEQGLEQDDCGYAAQAPAKDVEGFVGHHHDERFRLSPDEYASKEGLFPNERMYVQYRSRSNACKLALHADRFCSEIDQIAARNASQ